MKACFRTYKRTIKKVKLSSRTVRLARREAEVSLLAFCRFCRPRGSALRPTKAAAWASQQSVREGY